MRAEEVPAGLADRNCPDFGAPPMQTPPERSARRVAIISTAGLMHRGDAAFAFGASDYRVIDRQRSDDVVMSHVSTNFDRSGFVQDHEVVFPLHGLDALARAGDIGAVARYHYSFMGASDPQTMAPAATQLAKTLTGDGTNLALLVPV